MKLPIADCQLPIEESVYAWPACAVLRRGKDVMRKEAKTSDAKFARPVTGTKREFLTRPMIGTTMIGTNMNMNADKIRKPKAEIRKKSEVRIGGCSVLPRKKGAPAVALSALWAEH